jgi:hypothetical protein
MSEGIENQKIEKRLTTLEVLMTDTREDLKEIKDKVSNEIPHQIDGLKKEFYDYKVSNKTWLIGILVSLIFTLIVAILNLVIK